MITKTIVRNCPKCHEGNAFNLRNGQEDIFDIDEISFKCSFCNEFPSRFEWVIANKDKCVLPDWTEQKELGFLRWEINVLRKNQRLPQTVRVIALTEKEIANKVSFGQSVQESYDHMHYAITAWNHIGMAMHRIKTLLNDESKSESEKQEKMQDILTYLGETKERIYKEIRDAQENLRALSSLLDAYNDGRDRI